MNNFVVNVENLSASPQKRFTTVMLPIGFANKLPPLGTIQPWGWPCALGETVGEQRELQFIADLDGKEQTKFALDAIVADEGVTKRLPPILTDWLLDRSSDAIPRFALEIDGGPRQEFAFANTGIVPGPLCADLVFSSVAPGWRCDFQVRLPIAQDVFDIQGHAVWSQQGSPTVTKRCRVILVHGEQHHLDFMVKLGQSVWQPGQAHATDGYSVLFDSASSGDLPDSMDITFRGCLIAEPDVGQQFTNLRMSNAQAAHGGPIVALAGRDIWRGSIGPHRATWSDDVVTPATSGIDWTAGASVWGNRPLANAAATGQTGDQGCFGRIVGLAAVNGGRAEWVHALRYIATDLSYRSHHFLEPHGAPLAASWSDPRLTYGAYKHYRAAREAWGYPKFESSGGNPPWGWDHGERAYMDPQHRAALIHPLAMILTGDWLLQRQLDDLIATDTRDVRVRESQLEAPRAAGRMMQEWAWWRTCANQSQGVQLDMLADRMLLIVEQQPTMQTTRVVACTDVMSKFNEKNGLKNTTNPELGFDAWFPWQESLCVDGLVAYAAIWQRQGDASRMARALALAVRLANSVVDYGLYERPDGSFEVLTEVRYNTDGQPNDVAYMTVPRPGAKTTLEGNADLIYGGIALTWYSGAILTASKANNQKAQRARARLLASIRPTNVRDLQWVVGD